MSNDDYLKKLVEAKAQAASGVDYSPRFGAVCPSCATTRAVVTGSLPWDSAIKIRYHRCRNSGCPINQMGISIKSIEVDVSGVKEEEAMS
ncbi:MAG: transcriptional regulator [Proteobacteria bacterium]|nr:transcriptional regulator [Pseudomonadota bacterium]MBU1640090.1 transcriptional regulator [Pseudomonadota bacterium]